MLSEIERFVNWTRRRSPEARTWKDYGYDLRFFVEVVGDRPPKEITFRDVDRFIAVQSEKGFKPATINRRLASVISLYDFLAVEDDELAYPVIVKRHHVREHQRLPRPMDEESLRRFFAVIPCGHNLTDKRDRAMFLLMLRCRWYRRFKNWSSPSYAFRNAPCWHINCAKPLLRRRRRLDHPDGFDNMIEAAPERAIPLVFVYIEMNHVQPIFN